MITQEEVKELTKKFGKNENDTGSVAVQVALLTRRINNLTPHFKDHIHDFHSKRGLMKLIGQRRSLLKYYQRNNAEGYKTLIKDLGLRK